MAHLVHRFSPVVFRRDLLPSPRSFTFSLDGISAPVDSFPLLGFDFEKSPTQFEGFPPPFFGPPLSMGLFTLTPSLLSLFAHNITRRADLHWMSLPRDQARFFPSQGVARASYVSPSTLPPGRVFATDIGRPGRVGTAAVFLISSP